MSLNKAIITPAEADAFLAQETEWLAFDDTVKEYHIAYASVYMQTRWTCTDTDWSDDTTITDEQKEACAYYALASANSNLYTSAAEEAAASTGTLKEITNKLGSLVGTTKYYEGTSGSGSDPLEYPDTLMGVGCAYASGLGSRKLTRV